MGRKKYEEGGEVDPLEAANASEESQAIANEAKGDTILKRMRDEAAAPSFKEAFAAARAAKQGAFEWGGKKYSTAMAGENKAPARPSDTYSNEGRTAKAPMRQVTQSELAESYVKKQAARKAEADAEKAAREEARAETARMAKKNPAPASGRKRIDTSGLNPNTLLPSKTYKKGGNVRGWGMARGARKAKIV